MIKIFKRKNLDEQDFITLEVKMKYNLEEQKNLRSKGFKWNHASRSYYKSFSDNAEAKASIKSTIDHLKTFNRYYTIELYKLSKRDSNVDALLHNLGVEV